MTTKTCTNVTKLSEEHLNQARTLYTHTSIPLGEFCWTSNIYTYITGTCTTTFRNSFIINWRSEMF